jgi:hypothetical protein
MHTIRGQVQQARALLEGERLKAKLQVGTDSGEVYEAYLPDRELAALIPRTVLVGEDNLAPPELLGTIEPMLTRLTQARRVRVWSYRDRRYASFLSWRSVRFAGA